MEHGLKKRTFGNPISALGAQIALVIDRRPVDRIIDDQVIALSSLRESFLRVIDDMANTERPHRLQFAPAALHSTSPTNDFAI